LKEYIFLYNTDQEDKAMVNYLKEFLGEDVHIKDYGLIGGNAVDYFESIWVTRDKYKYAYAIANAPSNGDGEFYDIFSTEECVRWMQTQIDNGAVHKE